MRTREEDVVNHLFVASTHSYLMVFSDRGRAYWLKVHEIPDVGADGRGKAIANLVQMEAGEKIAAMLAVHEFDDTHFIVMGTRKGTVKKTELSAFSNPRAGGIIAMGIEEDDAVMAVQLSDGESEIFIGTRDGMAIRFPEDDVRPMGRTAYGVRGIQLREGDEVVAMEVVKPGGTLLTVTEKGYAKRTDSTNTASTGRGGLGLKNLEITDKNGAGRRHRAGARERGAAGHHRAGQDSAHAGQRDPHHRPGHAGRAADGSRRRGQRRLRGACRSRDGDESTVGTPLRASGSSDAASGRTDDDRRHRCSWLAPRRSVCAGRCSRPPEQQMLTQFFRAARARDNTTLGMMSAVTFDPRDAGHGRRLRDHSVGPGATHAARLQGAARCRSARRAAERRRSSRRRSSIRTPTCRPSKRSSSSNATRGEDDAGAAEGEGRVGQVARGHAAFTQGRTHRAPRCVATPRARPKPR